MQALRARPSPARAEDYDADRAISNTYTHIVSISTSLPTQTPRTRRKLTASHCAAPRRRRSRFPSSDPCRVSDGRRDLRLCPPRMQRSPILSAGEARVLRRVGKDVAAGRCEAATGRGVPAGERRLVVSRVAPLRAAILLMLLLLRRAAVGVAEGVVAGAGRAREVEAGGGRVGEGPVASGGGGGGQGLGVVEDALRIGALVGGA